MVINQVEDRLQLLAFLKSRNALLPTNCCRLACVPRRLAEKVGYVGQHSLGERVVADWEMFEVSYLRAPHMFPRGHCAGHKHAVVEQEEACKEDEAEGHEAE